MNEEESNNQIGKIRNESDRNPDGTFAIGNPGGPGRPPETEEQKLIKKANKQFIEEYVERLAGALPLISPILIAKAMEGDIQAIKEVNDRVMGKPRQNVGLDGGGEGLSIQFANVFKDADSTRTTKEDSSI